MPSNGPATAACDVKDLALADAGKRRIEWAFQSMPVLQGIRKQFIKEQPLAGVRVAACLPVTAESANLMVTLRDGGANAVLCSPDPLSIQDDAAAALVRDYGISVFAVQGANSVTCQAHLASALDHRPQITIDDGAYLATALHAERQGQLADLIGGAEASAEGIGKLRALAREAALQYPIISMIDAATRRLFDHRYGTGQSALDGIVRAANVLLAGATFVVAGYGWCGRGLAVRARGMGANVVVTEVDPCKALEALMDGFRVMSMAEAAAIGDLFCTVTGNRNVITKEHFERLKNGAILCNAGRSNVEIDLDALARMASSRRPTRDSVEEFALRDGRRIYLLGEGRVINWSAAEGHPAAVMDVIFAGQALAVEYLVKNRASLEKKCFPAPPEIDKQVARMKLDSMNVKIDRLTLEQERHLASWSEGT